VAPHAVTVYLSAVNRWGEVLSGTGRGRNATQSGGAGGGAGGAARGTIGLDGVPRRWSGMFPGQGQPPQRLFMLILMLLRTSGVLQAPHVAARSWHL
jgi:hypothetical protein